MGGAVSMCRAAELHVAAAAAARAGGLKAAQLPRLAWQCAGPALALCWARSWPGLWPRGGAPWHLPAAQGRAGQGRPAAAIPRAIGQSCASALAQGAWQKACA
jgi:hypothetical protein